MRKLFILAIVATMLAACTNNPVPQNKSFMDLARQRFAVREYAQTPVEQAKLDSILEAGRLAPTAKNVHPQHIYVLQSPEAIAKINALTPCAYGALFVSPATKASPAKWSRTKLQTELKLNCKRNQITKIPKKMAYKFAYVIFFV